MQVEANLQEKETYRKELTLAKEKVDGENDENGENHLPRLWRLFEDRLTRISSV